MSKPKWLGEVLGRKPGALHRQLGIPRGKTIPKSLLGRIAHADAGVTIKKPTTVGHRRYTVTTLLKRRARPVLTARGFKHRRRRGRILR